MGSSAKKIWAEMIQTKATQIIRCTEEIEELNGYIRDDIEKEEHREGERK